MPNPDLMVALAATVVGAGRTPAEMIESLPAEFVSVVIASELTETVTAEEAEAVVAGQEEQKKAAADLLWRTQSGVVS